MYIIQVYTIFHVLDFKLSYVVLQLMKLSSKKETRLLSDDLRYVT